MKSKLTLIAVLALGLLAFAGTATSFAADGSAGSAQYAPEEENSLCTENGGVEGANGCEYPCVEADGSEGEIGASSPGEPCEHQETETQESESQAPAPAPPAPPTALPYTGFPVVPALLVGLGLLGLGVTMRLRLRSGSGLA